MRKGVIQRFLSAEFTKFIIVGGVSAGLELSLLISFVELFKVDYLISNIFAFALTNIVTFILSRKFVFGASGNGKTYEASLFALFLTGGLLLNQVVLWMLVEFVQTDYRVAKIVAILITVIWNFFTRKHFVFKNRKVAPQPSPTPTSRYR
jgi:putative flippase GtrA